MILFGIIGFLVICAAVIPVSVYLAKKHEREDEDRDREHDGHDNDDDDDSYERRDIHYEN